MLQLIQFVLIGAAIVFVVDLIGNYVTFSNRFLNALVTGLIFTLAFGAYLFAFWDEPSTLLTFALAYALIGGAIVFIADLIGNMLTFNNRFVNALTTAVVFAVMFTGAMYALRSYIGGGIDASF